MFASTECLMDFILLPGTIYTKGKNVPVDSLCTSKISKNTRNLQ